MFPNHKIPGGIAVGVVYDLPESAGFDVVGGHRPRPYRKPSGSSAVSSLWLRRRRAVYVRVNLRRAGSLQTAHPEYK